MKTQNYIYKSKFVFLAMLCFWACRFSQPLKQSSFPQIYGSEDHVFLEIFEDSTYVIQSPFFSPLGCFVNFGKVSIKDNGIVINFVSDFIDTGLSVNVSEEIVFGKDSLIMVISSSGEINWNDDGWISQHFKLSYCINQSDWVNFSSDTTILFFDNKSLSKTDSIQFRYANFDGRYNCTKIKNEFHSSFFHLKSGSLYHIKFDYPTVRDALYHNTEPMEGRIINDSIIFLRNGLDSSFNQLFFKGGFYPNLEPNLHDWKKRTNAE